KLENDLTTKRRLSNSTNEYLSQVFPYKPHKMPKNVGQGKHPFHNVATPNTFDFTSNKPE
ncbi:hypothetical protein FBU30_000768, partial [Linnemannia zychae]